MQNIKSLPAYYYRSRKDVFRLVGRTGEIVASTFLRVSSPELTKFLPYSFVIVKLDDEIVDNKTISKNTKQQNDFGGKKQLFNQKIELMGTPDARLNVGNRVRLEFRVVATPEEKSIISYGLKAVKI